MLRIKYLGELHMSYAVVHMIKIGKGGLRGIQSHNQREKEPHTNPDIDKSKSAENYDLLNASNINYNKAVKERIENFATATKTVRKDAVVMCNFIVTSDKQFFDNLSNEGQKKFFIDSIKFFADRYGGENLVNATIHLDEKTPHMHLGVVPITADGRLSAKTLFDKKELQSLQTQFFYQVGSKYGLERGVEGSERTHLSEQRFKIATAQQELEKAQGVIKTLKEEKKSLQGQIKGLETQIEEYKSLRGAVVPVKEKKRLLSGKVTEVTMAKEVYDACVSAQMCVDYAEIKAKRAEEKTAEVQKSASYTENVKLRELLADSQNSNRFLKDKLTRANREINRVNEVFKRNPEVQKAFVQTEKTIQKSMSRGFER